MKLGLFRFKISDESLKETEAMNIKLEDEKNPPSLEDILDMDCVIREYNRKNKKLIEFFTKERIKQMLDYIIKEPKIDDFSKAHKYPFICSQLLNIDVHDVKKYFFMTNNEIIQEKNMYTEEYDSDKSLEDFEKFLDNQMRKNEFKENDEEQNKYKNDKDNNKDKFKDYNIHENKKDDTDDKNDKNEKEEKNKENKKDEIKQIENIEIENNYKIKENKIEKEQDNLINYENSNDKEEEIEKKEETQKKRNK